MMTLEEVEKECPLYGVCRDSRSNRVIKEDRCTSGNPEQYISCNRYNPLIALIAMPIEKLDALGVKLKF